MKKFIFKLSVFLGPFLVALALELFVLPIDFFTFRVHEALVVRKFRNILGGKFYPNRNLLKEEEGDLGHHTKYAFKRTVQWFTDSRGYRKKESGQLKYEVVIIGQSETFGASLTQRGGSGRSNSRGPASGRFAPGRGPVACHVLRYRCRVRAIATSLEEAGRSDRDAVAGSRLSRNT